MPRCLPSPFCLSGQAFGAKTQVWEVDGYIDDESGQTVESASYVLKVSHLRPNKAINAARFMRSAQAANPSAAAAKWLPELVGVHLQTQAELEAKATYNQGRIPVALLTKGRAWDTWANRPKSTSLSLLWRSFRDAIRCLFLLLPMRLRDISPANLLYTIGPDFDANTAIEKLRMQAVLAFEERWPPPCGSVFDFDRARAEEPSDFARRREAAASDVQADESIEDAWTGTVPYLSRAQTELNRALPSTSSATTAHRPWHDLESLCLCILFGSFARWSHLDALNAQLHAFRTDLTIDKFPFSWVDHLSDTLHQVVWSEEDNLPDEELELAAALQRSFAKMRKAFEATIALPGERAAARRERLFLQQDDTTQRQTFRTILEVAISTIVELKAIEDRMSTRAGRTLRTRKVTVEASGSPRKAKRV